MGMYRKDHYNAFLTQQEKWEQRRVWCNSQGWIVGEDYFPPSMYRGEWKFNTEQKELLFILKWGSNHGAASSTAFDV